MYKIVSFNIWVLIFNILSISLAQVVPISINQPINIKNTCTKGFSSTGAISTGQISLRLNSRTVSSFPINSDVISTKIYPGQYAKFGDTISIYCNSDRIINVNLIDDLIGSNIQSSYLAYIYNNKTYIPNIYLDAGSVLSIGNKNYTVYKDGRGKYIDAGIEIFKYNIARVNDSSSGLAFQLSITEGKRIAIVSAEEFTNLSSLISAYKKIKGADTVTDWQNISFYKAAELQKPANQINEICGKNIYVLGNVSELQQASLSNVSSISQVPVNPTGSLWPTGIAEMPTLARSVNTDVATLSNLKDRHAEYARNEVIIHVLDTASRELDEYSSTIGQVSKDGHGSIIGRLIEEMINRSGFNDKIKVDYVDVCSGSMCDPIAVTQKICEIAKSARKNNKSLHIINLSMSSRDPQEFLRLAIKDAVKANVSVVMSSGNGTTCNGDNTGYPNYECLLFPVDYFNVSGFRGEIDRKTYTKTLTSTAIDAVNLYPQGIYSVGSLYNKKSDDSINRKRPFGSRSGIYIRSNIPSIYAPSFFYYKAKNTLYAGTSFSSGYFSAALGMYRSCDRLKTTGPSIFSDTWAQMMSETPSLSLDVDRMLAGICY